MITLTDVRACNHAASKAPRSHSTAPPSTASTSKRHGGAAASIGLAKQRRIVFAARHYLMRLREPPPCRFDVVVVDGENVQWLRAAFDAG